MKKMISLKKYIKSKLIIISISVLFYPKYRIYFIKEDKTKDLSESSKKRGMTLNYRSFFKIKKQYFSFKPLFKFKNKHQIDFNLISIGWPKTVHQNT